MTVKQQKEVFFCLTVSPLWDEKGFQEEEALQHWALRLCVPMSLGLPGLTFSLSSPATMERTISTPSLHGYRARAHTHYLVRRQRICEIGAWEHHQQRLCQKRGAGKAWGENTGLMDEAWKPLLC